LLSLIIILSLNTPHRIFSAISTFTIPHQEKPIIFLIKRKETGNLKEIKRYLSPKNDSDFLSQPYPLKSRKKTLNVIPQNPLILKNHAHVQFLPSVFLLKSIKKIQLTEKKRQIIKEPNFELPAQSETSVITENSEKDDEIIFPWLTLEDDILFSFAELSSLEEEKKDPLGLKSIFLEKIPVLSPSQDDLFLFPIFKQDQLKISDSIALSNSISRDEEISSHVMTDTISEMILPETSETSEATLPISMEISPSTSCPQIIPILNSEVPTLPTKLSLPIAASSDMGASNSVTSIISSYPLQAQTTPTTSSQIPPLPASIAVPIAASYSLKNSNPIAVISSQTPTLSAPAAPVASSVPTSSNVSAHIPVKISLPNIASATKSISSPKTTSSPSNTKISVATPSLSTKDAPKTPPLSRATSASSAAPIATSCSLKDSNLIATISNQAPTLSAPAAPIASSVPTNSNVSAHIPVKISLPNIASATKSISSPKTTSSPSNTKISVATPSLSTKDAPKTPPLSRAPSASSAPLLSFMAGQESDTDVSEATAGKNLKPHPTSTRTSYSPSPHDQYPKKTQTLTETTYKGYLRQAGVTPTSSFNTIPTLTQTTEAPHPAPTSTFSYVPQLEVWQRSKGPIQAAYDAHLKQAEITSITVPLETTSTAEQGYDPASITWTYYEKRTRKASDTFLDNLDLHLRSIYPWKKVSKDAPCRANKKRLTASSCTSRTPPTDSQNSAQIVYTDPHKHIVNSDTDDEISDLEI